MFEGSCLCGLVKYRLDADIDKVIFCHCSRCRKFTGSAFTSVSLISADSLTLTAGKDALTQFEFNGVFRYFCSRCGSGIYTVSENMPDKLILQVGTVDSSIYPSQKMHIFTDSKANWDEIPATELQFSQLV